MVLIYWALALPHRTNVGTAWVAGLLLDVLLGSTLGVRAMAMAITTYLAAFQFQKIRNFSLWQQALIIGCLAGGQGDHLLGRAPVQPRQPQFRLLLVDPEHDANMALGFLVLRKVRRRFNIK